MDKFWKIRIFQRKIWILTYILYLLFAIEMSGFSKYRANGPDLEQVLKGATRFLPLPNCIGFLDVFWQLLWIPLARPSARYPPAPQDWSSKGRGRREGTVSQNSRRKGDNKLECTSKCAAHYMTTSSSACVNHA